MTTFQKKKKKIKKLSDLIAAADSGDLLNNNCGNDANANVDYSKDFNEYYSDDEEVFDTNFVGTSLASASNFSKSLNDIHINNDEIIPMRPNSLAICTDDQFMYNDSCKNNNNCNVNDNYVSTSQFGEAHYEKSLQ